MNLSWLLLNLFSLLVGIGGVLFTLCTNSVIRTKALASPGTPAFLLIKMVDPLLDATIYRTIKGLEPRKVIDTEGRARVETGPIAQQGGLHSFLGIEDMTNIRQSFVASIDLGMKLPTWLVKHIGNPATAIGLAMLVGYLVLVGSFFIMSTIINAGVAMIIAVSMAGILGRLMYKLFTGPGSFFEVVQNLHYWPHSIIQLDATAVTVQSGWSKTITPNDNTLKFSKIISGTSKGMQLVGKQEKHLATVFMYHELFEHLIMTESELDVLIARLNSVLDLSKVATAV